MSAKKFLKIICALEAEGLLRDPIVRNYWVHPYFLERESNHRFQKFFANICNYEDKFFQYYRMSKNSFDELLEILKPYISKQNTQFRRSISAEERLTVTLR